jgi:hypothetical protein
MSSIAVKTLNLAQCSSVLFWQSLRYFNVASMTRGETAPKRPEQAKISALSRMPMPRIWKPSVTVAAIVEKDGNFLLIEEETSDGIRINQPAGHLDPYEWNRRIRETLEETATISRRRRWWACICRATVQPHGRRSDLSALHLLRPASSMTARWTKAFCAPCG